MFGDRFDFSEEYRFARPLFEYMGGETAWVEHHDLVVCAQPAAVASVDFSRRAVAADYIKDDRFALELALELTVPACDDAPDVSDDAVW